jgi:hypothetical protein
VPTLTGQAIKRPVTIHYRLIRDCVPFLSPLTTRRDYGGGILTCLHTGQSWRVCVLHRDTYCDVMAASQPYRRADNSRPVSFTVSAWERVYATNLSRLQRETREREGERERETTKRHVGEAHTVLQQRSYYLNARVVTEAEQCHCACSPILGSPTCVWSLRNREPPARICSPTYNSGDRRKCCC